MKSTEINLKKFGSLLIGLFIIGSVKAATYTTMNAGDWNDVVSVWSLDGGVTPCGCTPGSPSAGNDIVVNHALTLSSNLIWNGGTTVLVNPGASLSGPVVINLWNASVDFFGDITISKWAQDFNTNVTMHPGTIMSLNNRFVMADGNFTLDGALIYMALGNFDISAPANFNALNASRVNIEAGNINNNGNVFIELGSCMTANGNWKNGATGTVSGGGSATTTVGNMQNNGTWDINILWCSAGADFGMPSPEDCPGAITTCGGITLPVELIDFVAKYLDDYAEITWTTLSENNNDYFILLKSTDGKNWNELSMIDGQGTTTESTEYSALDYDVEMGITYYQLKQVDFDGRANYSEVIALERKAEAGDIMIYPNPAVSGNLITIGNLLEATGTISIVNTTGRTVVSETINGFAGKMSISLPQLTSGIYIVAVEQNGDVRSSKLIIR